MLLLEMLKNPKLYSQATESKGFMFESRSIFWRIKHLGWILFAWPIAVTQFHISEFSIFPLPLRQSYLEKIDMNVCYRKQSLCNRQKKSLTNTVDCVILIRFS